MNQRLRRALWTACAGSMWMLAPPAFANICIYSPKAGAPVAQLQDGKDVVALSAARPFDPCARVQVAKGVAIAHYFNKSGERTAEEVTEGHGVDAGNFGSAAGGAAGAASTKTVARGVMAVLTEGKERTNVGQKFFDKPAQVGAPFGDVYIPQAGLTLRFVNLEGDARVQLVDAATQASLLEAVAAQGMTLDRARFRAGGKYVVRVTTARGKLPPGAFEVAAADATAEIDKALKAIDADARLDAAGRSIARALLFEQEGLPFNRELALKELKP